MLPTLFRVQHGALLQLRLQAVEWNNALFMGRPSFMQIPDGNNSM